MDERLKKILCFIALILIVLGFFGSIGWLIYSKAWAILAGCIVLGAAAVPTVIKLFNVLKS